MRIAAAALSLTLAALTALPAAAQSAPPLLPLERQMRDGPTAPDRIAVVFGLGQYQSIPALRNTTNDARAMADMLRGYGFRIIEGYDLDKRAMEAMLRQAVSESGPRTEAVFFFSGHGIQIADQSYLLPVEANLRDPYDVPFQTLALDSMLNILRGRSEVQVSFLDSCRNNPFEGGSAISSVRGIGAPILRGFSQPQPPAGGLIAYSTSPGALALDGTGSNSPYTEALLSAARLSPDTSLDTLLTAVGQLVQQSTGGQQVPIFASALPRPFVLRSIPALSAPPASFAAPTPSVAPIPAQPGVITAPTASVFGSAGLTPTAPSGGSIVAPRERLIAIGQRLLQALDIGASRIRLGAAPAGYAYGLRTIDGTITALPARDLRPGEIGTVVLRQTAPVSTAHAPQSGIQQASLGLTADGSQRSAPLSLVANACDTQAGDWFDPQGTGLYRLDQALRADSAIATCQRALTADPLTHRFRFQLARGLAAAGRQGEAEAQFRQAAQSGHIRAWRRLGDLLASRGDLNGARSAYDQGHRAGDPLATAALGSLLLQTATTDDERQAAYDLLTEGVDLGLPDAMLGLARYYATPGAPDYDPARAARFQREAASRAPAIANVSAPAPAPTQGIGPDRDRDEPNDSGGGDGRQ